MRSIFLILGTIIGFFAQTVNEALTEWLRSAFDRPSIILAACSPLENLTLVVKSRSEEQIKIHSAEPAPAVQVATVYLKNNLESSISNLSIFIAINQHLPWDVDFASFSTNSLINHEHYSVIKERFLFKTFTEQFVGDEELIFSFVMPLPANIYVEVSSDYFSTRRIVSAGECDSQLDRQTLLLKAAFYDFVNQAELDPGFSIKDIEDPIGPIEFDLYYSYNCGRGRQSKVIPYGGEYDVCGATLSPMLENEGEGIPMPAIRSDPWSVR